MKILSHFFKRILASIALFSLELLVVWIVFLISLVAFFYISKEIFFNKREYFDLLVFGEIDEWTSPTLTTFMKTITFLASWKFILFASAVILIYFLFIKKHHWYSLKIPVVALGSISLNVLMKNIFDRPRPLLPHLVDAYGLSFPSGHAMVSCSFYGLLIYLVWHNVEHKFVKWFLCITLLVIIHLIGFSRIYLHVHYASDVMAGFALGLIWLFISILVLRKIEKYSAKNVKNIPETINIGIVFVHLALYLN